MVMSYKSRKHHAWRKLHAHIASMSIDCVNNFVVDNDICFSAILYSDLICISI